MKKELFAGLLSVLFIVGVAAAANPKSPADYNGLNKGKSDVIHLYLYEKDSSWDIVEDGAWGKMTARKGSFVFNGHGLEPSMDYALINYVDPWPGTGSVWMGEGTSDQDGNIHLSGSMEGVSGKVWLVLSSDFDGDKMTGWSPGEYLFEYDLI